jgi:predicted permease
MLSDIRHALRLMRRQPAYTASVIGILGFGLAANAAIYSVALATILRPAPFADPRRLLSIENYSLQRSDPFPVKAADYLEIRSRTKSFAELALVRRGGESFNVFANDRPERLLGGVQTASTFRLLGVAPRLGRVFTDEEERSGNVVVLSDGLWREMFGGDVSIVGRTIVLNGKSFEVIGVMPPELVFPVPEVRLWVPLAMDEKELRSRFLHRYSVYARLRPDVGREAAAREVAALGDTIRSEHPKLNRDIGMRIAPFESQATLTLQSTLALLAAAGTLLLLLVCANIANLMLVRGYARRKEMQIREALGAQPLALLRQSIVESLLLAFPGAVLGLLLAHASLPAILRLAPAAVHGLSGASLNPTVVLATFLLAAVSAVGVGAVPFFSVRDASALRERSGAAAPRRLRQILVGTEVGLCVFLLIGTGLLYRTMNNLLRGGSGMRLENVLAVRLALAPNRYPSEESQTGFFRELRARAAALPGVTSAALINRMPLDGSLLSGPVQVQGRERQIPDHADHRSVSNEFFATLGVPLRQGRLFTEADTPQGAPVVVIDEVVAKRYFGTESPIGKRIQPGSPQLNLPYSEIVGVVGTVRMDGPDRIPRGQVYAPYRQRGSNDRMTLIVKTHGDPAALAPAIRTLLRELDPRQPIVSMQAAADLFDLTIWHRTFALVLASIFGLAAVILSMAGLYSVLAFSVHQRRQEIGVRMALGAKASNILRLFVTEGVFLAGIGAAAGAVAASGAGSWIQSYVYGVSTQDPTTFALALLLVLLVSAAASIGPACSAAATDPLEHLRHT